MFAPQHFLRQLPQGARVALAGWLGGVRLTRHDKWNNPVRPPKLDEVTHLLVDPLGPSRPRRADHDKEPRILQLFAQTVVQHARRDVRLVEEDRLEVLRQVRRFLADGARQPVCLQLALQPFRPLGILVLVTDEGVILEPLIANDILAHRLAPTLSSPSAPQGGRVASRL